MYTRDQIIEMFSQLFSIAEKNGGLDYIYCLVRVAGLSCSEDPLITLERLFNREPQLAEPDDTGSLDLFTIYFEEPLGLIYNLIRCSSGERYQPVPFASFYSGDFVHRIKPSCDTLIHEVVMIADNNNLTQLAQIIREAYTNEIKQTVEQNTTINDSTMNDDSEIVQFLTIFLEVYKQRRLAFPDGFHKLPDFTVIELIKEPDVGLIGFNFYFSNGSKSAFKRYSNGTECINLYFSDGITFMIGDVGELSKEWRVADKRLWEIGLKGRYNCIGDWKPIVYPADATQIISAAERYSADPDTQGIIFYIMTTCHWAIEFVVRTNIELPYDQSMFGDKLYLHKISQDTEQKDNYYIYDGWLELESIDEESIKIALFSIGSLLNRLAFAFDATLKWRLKYDPRNSMRGCAAPTKEDMEFLNIILKTDHDDNDGLILNSALDWYARGNISGNILNSFMCYFVSIESVVQAVADGDADFNLGYERKTKEQRKAERENCIIQRLKTPVEKDYRTLIEEIYFECIIGLKEKIRRVAVLVFGEDHEYIKLLFTKNDDGVSLNDIRGGIAHGSISLLFKEDEEMVSKYLPYLKEIAREFLLRLLLKIKPWEEPPSWSMEHYLSINMMDPRSTQVASTESIFHRTDWTIGREWIDD